jgi:hypothetical protein
LNIQLIATYAAAVLTVMIFSYLLGDNFLYRLGVAMLVGAAAGYSLIVAVESVIIPWIKLTLITGFGTSNFVIGLLPILIAALLALKISPRLSRFGNIGLAFVLGVGGAVAIWGAVSGTLLPLALDAAREFTPANAIDGFIALVGTLSTLIYFTYLGVRRPSGEVTRLLPIQLVARIGQGFIMITLGATYALVILSALTIFTGVLVQRLLILKPN